MSVANVLEEGVSITPQRLFRMSRPQRLDGVNRLTMDIDGHAAHGVSPTATLGILIDDILGFTLWDRRGDRAGVVTADLSVDFVTPTGWVGPEVVADGRAVAITGDGGIASTELRDGAGTLLATATAWGNFVDGNADRSTSVVRPSSAPGSIPDASVSSLTRIGARFEDHDAGARLVVPANPALANKLGVMHGGIQACAVDLVGAAALSRPDAPMYTASMRINFFRPAPVDADVTFTAEVVRAGRSVAVARVTSTGSDGRECAVATVTCRRPSR
ncbi:PaaI family thioesterase [Prescottella equi]|uniref:PaaI family thioesterase n=1 Tax=Rhodococcus hoagii TaxID=43767 RepID=UPI000A0FDE45|nr:hotdog fold thioesterase [Prescottella equi]NKR25739.1 hotdog fold thioesterase [Prescottella equi]NKR39407.1 hotdog fold thioesterase [Prescottella equi]NKR46788.1 hotdog fold thioesterase [Prescottella equi]NKR61187.1 hotdog fold thioesterase [Prescottella equi]NKR68885.1 hotdog fold thioesterase [Prescottella equi]